MVIRVKDQKVSPGTYAISEVRKQMEVAERYLFLNTERDILLTEKQKKAIQDKQYKLFRRIDKVLQYPKNIQFYS